MLYTSGFVDDDMFSHNGPNIAYQSSISDIIAHTFVGLTTEDIGLVIKFRQRALGAESDVYNCL